MTTKECIDYLNKLLAFKGVRCESDRRIHQGLCVLHLEYAREFFCEKDFDSAWTHTSKALEHIRISYTASRESGEECEMEQIIPEGYDESPFIGCWNNPGYPYLIEADVWLEKARICMKKKNWIAANGCIQHAESFCKVTTRNDYDNILDGIPECYPDDCIQDCPERIIYYEIKRERKEIMEHVDVSLFNRNTPSDEFLLQYTWHYNPVDDIKLFVEHWRGMITRRDFYIFSEQQCYLILLEFYFFYWVQLTFEEKERLLDVILGLIDKVICASPDNTELKEDTLMNPWVICADDGRTFNAYQRPKSVENQEVRYWALMSDLYRQPVHGKERESLYSKMHAEFLDGVYFFDTKEYALMDEYFTPEYLACAYINTVNEKTSLDLIMYAKELLEINPAAKLNDLVGYIQMRADEAETVDF